MRKTTIFAFFAILSVTSMAFADSSILIGGTFWSNITLPNTIDIGDVNTNDPIYYEFMRVNSSAGTGAEAEIRLIDSNEFGDYEIVCREKYLDSDGGISTRTTPIEIEPNETVSVPLGLNGSTYDLKLTPKKVGILSGYIEVSVNESYVNVKRS